ncbi:hypothetical protein MUK42_31262 [Musa troglodytarum]|uniref:Uncharacterized protein n=1 Tax=Musa troglodytarum TaxID=320322 RepID=A0A9E7KFF2_9LILI|nr:hypothetical protein MUK42_31262 [Musa troglodytarum]
MYTALRRTTVVFTMIVEYHLLTRQKHSRHVVGSYSEVQLDAFYCLLTVCNGNVPTFFFSFQIETYSTVILIVK